MMAPTNQLRSPADEQQEKLLDESLSTVKVQSFHMKCCLDKGKLMESLKHASNMLSELRTSSLSPKSYYELYMAVTDQLRHLEMHLVDEFQREHKVYELYELVQYAGSIIPRLYLLISVGLVYMKTAPYCRKEILRDLVEMCRGVQHPLRGLFLRNFLLQTCRHVLPDVQIEIGALSDDEKSDAIHNHHESVSKSQFVSSTLTQASSVVNDGDAKIADTASVIDSIDFVLTNFAEMNKLWVRMQHLGHTREKERREKERLELRLLVGTNLVRLSQLESVNMDIYSRVVLPGILEQVVSCKDAIAQEYLMESLIQVFPDEFHLATLNPFLNSCAQLAPEVKVKNIIIALIDRLASSHDIHLPDDLFDTFNKQISNIIEIRSSTVLIDDIISMYGSLINFSMKKIFDSQKREYAINSVLGSTFKAIQDKHVLTINLRTVLGKEMCRFLKLPFNLSTSSPTYLSSTSIETGGGKDGTGSNHQTSNDFSLIKMSLKLTNFKNLLNETTDIELHKQIILTLINATLENYSEDRIQPDDRLSSSEIDTFLNELCSPLVTGTNRKKDTSSGQGKSLALTVAVDDQDEDFIDEQLLLSRFIHYLLLPQCISADKIENGDGEDEQQETTPDREAIRILDTTYLTLVSIKNFFSEGGPSRIRYTYPSLIFEALQLALRYKKVSQNDSKWMKKCQKVYQYVHQLIMTLLKESSCPELCLRLFLEAALNAAKSKITDSESVSYEFISQAFSIYEDEISDSKEQILCLMLIISTVKNVQFENDENFIPLRNQCCLNCGKLVKKSDQCRAILSSSALFVSAPINDSSTVVVDPDIMKCFKKCLKISANVLDASLQLQIFIEIFSFLTLYIRYEQPNEIRDLIQSLGETIQEKRSKGALTDLNKKQLQAAIAFYKKNGLEPAISE